MDLSKVYNIGFEDVDHNDYPDYCDAYISEACYGGVQMTEEQLEFLNKERDFVIKTLMGY